jgi:hypothetical protein
MRRQSLPPSLPRGGGEGRNIEATSSETEATHDRLMQDYFSDPCVYPSLVAVDRICCWSDMNKIGFDCYVACSEC